MPPPKLITRRLATSIADVECFRPHFRRDRRTGRVCNKSPSEVAPPQPAAQAQAQSQDSQDHPGSNERKASVPSWSSIVDRNQNAKMEERVRELEEKVVPKLQESLKECQERIALLQNLKTTAESK